MIRKLAIKEPLMIEIWDGGTLRGKMTPDQFRKGVEAPKSLFLDDVVKQWNAWNKSKGKDLVAKVILVK
jgi:hypothetical protein